jgi:carboxypeptidase family protein/TonB-dependent receptor-like protein
MCLRLLKSIAALCCLCLLVVSPMLAQTTTGVIEGVITDASGAGVAGVVVTAVSEATGTTRTAQTTTAGEYTFTDLQIGIYKLTISADGFRTVVSKATVSTGAVTRADVALQVGQRNETVMVEGEAPLMDLSPNETNFVDNLKIENVPLNGRDFNSLLAITPGVQRTPGGGFLAVSINGSRTTSNNYFIDGLYNNDRYYGDSAINQTGVVGIPATIFPPEAIQELSVQENPSAEFGVKGGAPILLGMKSGTNDFHGWAQWIRHTSFADAANFFSKSNGCTDPGSCESTPLRNMQFGGGVGGPIIKDRTFFFIFYEGQRYASQSITSRTVPSTADVAGAMADIAAQGLTVNPAGQNLLSYFPITNSGTFVASTPTTARMDEFAFKIDHRINKNNTINGRYIFGDDLQSGPPFAGLPAGGGHPADLFNSIAPTRAQMAGISWTWTVSNNKILESRLGYTRFAQIIDINNKIDPKTLGVDTGPLSPVDFGVPYVYLAPLGYGGYIGGVQGYPITTRPDSTWDWSEHFSWVKGNHTIKFGGNYQTAYTNSLRNRARTGLSIGYSIAANGYAPVSVQTAVEELLLGRADFASRNFGDTKRYLTQKSVGFYGQDEWKIRPNFTLTYGLRYEINGALGEEQDRASNFFPDRGLVQVGQGISRLYNLDKGDFGPRLGFAWDVFKNGKTNLRGGYSLSYDVANFGALAAPYSFAGDRAGAFTNPDLGGFSVSLAGLGYSLENSPAATCADPTNGIDGDYICFGNGNPIFGTNPSGTPPFNAFAVAPNFKTPRAHNYNLGIQHQLFTNNVLSVTYSGQHGDDLIIYRDLNATPLGSGCTGSACDPLRPFATADPDLRHIVQATNLGTSRYDSLQVSYNQRGWHGLDTQYNLTWSKCFDENSVNRGGAGDYPQLQNPLNIADSRGLCDQDVTLNFNVGGVYDFPTIPHVEQHVAKGWRLSTIYTALSGRPFSVLVGGGTDHSGQGLSGDSLRASWDGTPVHYNTRNPNQYFDETYTVAGQADPCGNTSGGLPLSPFYIPCDGTVGNSTRNMLRGPGLSQWDASLIKDTKISERVSVQFRWEVYNVLNRANFYGVPNNTLNGGGLGTITKTPDVAVGNPVVAQGGPRNMNFALKFLF